MGWKGDATLIRTITAGASFRAMGMQSEEVLWKIPEAANTPDFDGDGVVRELSVGDITAMTGGPAILPTPTELERLADLGYRAGAHRRTEIADREGTTAFTHAGCATCHTPAMRLAKTRLEEPTARGNGNYFDRALASKDANYDPKRPFFVDLLKDAEEPRVEPDPKGGVTVRLYSDSKRHAMGRLLADPPTPTIRRPPISSR